MQVVTYIPSSQVTWQAYRDLRLEALREEPQAFGSSYAVENQKDDSEWQKRLQSYQLGKENWMVFAQCDGKLVGMVGAWQAEKDAVLARANVFAMYVNKAFRGQGIGGQLIKVLIQKLQPTPVKKLVLNVNPNQPAAVALYLKSGFVVVSAEQQRLGDGQLHEVLSMEKEIK